MLFSNKEIKELREEVAELRRMLYRSREDHREYVWKAQDTFKMILDACGFEYFEEEPKRGYRKIKDKE